MLDEIIKDGRKDTASNQSTPGCLIDGGFMSSQLITFRDIWGAKGPGMAGMVDMTLHPYQSGSYVSRMSDMQSNLLISYDDMMGFKWFLYVFIILCDFYHFYIEIIYIYI